MESYFRAQDHRKVYKLSADQDGKATLFWVTVWKDAEGSFHHGRGGDRIESYEKGLEVCRLMAKPCQPEDYIDALKDYFAIDKKIREAFIRKYNL